MVSQSKLIKNHSELKPARIDQTTTDYFGTNVDDSYQWMEKKENAKELKLWMLEQGRHTAAMADKNPYRDVIYSRLLELQESSSMVYRVQRAGDYIFYMYSDETSQIAKLMVRDQDGNDSIVVDPAVMSGEDDEHMAVDNYAPSHDGKYVAYNLSSGGGELTDIHFVETQSGEKLPEVLTWIWGEFRAEWLPDNSGVTYTRMTRTSQLDTSVNKLHNMDVYLHKLGTPVETDILVLGVGKKNSLSFAPEEFPVVSTRPSSTWALGYGFGARGEYRVFASKMNKLVTGNPEWKEVAEYSDFVEGNTQLVGDTLFYSSSKNAPNKKIFKVSLKDANLDSASIIVPEQAGVLTGFKVHKNWLYFASDVNGKSSLFKKNLNGGEISEIKLPYAGSLTLDGQPQGDSAFIFSLEGWTKPREYFEYIPRTESVSSIGLKFTSAADLSDIIVERVEATSHDGVKVPLTIIRSKNIKKDGNNPTIMNGYGGYGFSRNPRFNSDRLAWYEQGGIYAYAHVRGGGEKGKQWHVDGKGAKKKNGIRDFVACAQYLIDEGYTSSSHLAVEGGSMGGILLGRSVTENPELFDASAIYVGMLNPLRYLESQNGANQTAELGAKPDTKEGFDILFNMDSYHNLKPNIDYPSLMIVVGLNDQRVEPWESAKFVAKAQALSRPGNKVLLRASEGEGHGIGSTKDQSLRTFADIWSFYLKEFETD